MAIQKQQYSMIYNKYHDAYSGLNPKLPDFMLPRKKKAVTSTENASAPPPEEPVAGTSTGGQTVPVHIFLKFL